MSVLAKSTFGLSCVVAAGIVGYVHYKQNTDRAKLHEGVIRDVERQQMRKRENLYHLQQQINLTQKLKKNLEAEEEQQETHGS